MAGVVVGMKRTTDAAAVRWASAEAVAAGRGLHLVHAWTEPVNVSVRLDPGSLPGLITGATAWAVHGDTVEVLLGRQPDLLVLGVGGDHRRASRLVRSCVRRAGCALVVVPDGTPGATRRVVAAVRFGDTSRTALRWAAAQAGRRRARLVVVHVWQIGPASAGDMRQPGGAIPAQRNAVRARLNAWVRETLGAVDADVETVYGGPLDALLEYGAAADLMVLGRRAHSGVPRLLHDALGNDLIGLAPCPVAVIPHSTTPATTSA
jgi:nucleotide-binding universal stress UspA family protein